MNILARAEARTNRRPTEAQAKAGNYAKGKLRLHGLEISIENPRGSIRRGIGEDGRPWQVRMPVAYGYIRRTEGSDGDQIDVFIGPHIASPRVFAIDQNDLRTGQHDEHKIMLGFASKEQARNAYLKAFSDGKGKARIGHIEHMTVDAFKNWLRDGDTRKPIKRRADGGRVAGMVRPGTIDLARRPVVRNADGTISTVRSIGINDGGREMLIPTVSPDGAVLSNDDAVRLYRMSGQHLGEFDTPSNSDAYAQRLHEDQAEMYRAEGGKVMTDDEVFGSGPLTDEQVFGKKEQPPDSGKMDAALRGARAGALFNLGDEIEGARANAPNWVPEVVAPGIPARTIAGAGRTAYGYLTGDKDITGTYERERDLSRKNDEAAKTNHPYVYAGSEIAGAVPAMAALPELGAAKALAPAARGIARFGARTLDAAVTGGEYGALSGAGEGNDTADRAVNAATGLVSGIIGGGAGNVVGEGLGAAATRYGAPVVNTVRGWINPEGEGAKRVAGALRPDQEMIAAGTAQGLTPAQWAAARARGEPVTLADLGAGRTQALLRSAANTSPEGRAQLEQTVEGRFLRQNERVADTVRNALPGGQANARKTADQLVAEYDLGRVPAYRQAYQQGDRPLITPAMERLMGTDTFVGAMKRAISSGKDRDAVMGLGGFNPMVNVTQDGRIVFNRGANGIPTYPNLQYWDQVKRELDSVATMAQRSGDKERADLAGNMAKTLRTELDRMVPSYAKARGIAEQYFGESNALEAGRKLAGKKMDPAEVSSILRQMKPDEQALFKEGYASDLANRVLEGMADTTNVTKGRGILQSPNERRMAQVIFGPGGVAQIEARMYLEKIMDGARQAMGNSTTARQLIEAGLAGGAIGGVTSGWDPTTMGAWGAGAMTSRAGASKLLSDEARVGLKHMIGKVDARTARRVAELLTSNDPRLLRQGYQMAAKSQAIMDGLYNIARRIGITGQTATRQPATETLRALQGPVGARADENQQQP